MAAKLDTLCGSGTLLDVRNADVATTRRYIELQLMSFPRTLVEEDERARSRCVKLRLE